MDVNKDRQERAIYAFTLVTVIFLPLSSVASIFGMNTTDVREMNSSQWLYWAVAIPVTICILVLGLWWMEDLGPIVKVLRHRFRGKGKQITASVRKRVTRGDADARERRGIRMEDSDGEEVWEDVREARRGTGDYWVYEQDRHEWPPEEIDLRRRRTRTSRMEASQLPTYQPQPGRYGPLTRHRGHGYY